MVGTPEHSRRDTAEFDYWESVAARSARLPPGDPRRRALRTEAIEGYLPLADRLAGRYAHTGEPMDDLIQVARLGLVKAVDRFDPSRGALLGYAVSTIRGELRHHFRDHCGRVGTPRRLRELGPAVHGAGETLTQRLGRVPRPDEIAGHLDVPAEDVAEVLRADAAHRVTSLDGTAGGDPDGPPRAETIGAADPALAGVPDRVSMRPVLRRLPERERRALLMRFFLNMTQVQIADRLGISQMHVSRVLVRALSALRSRLDTEPGDTGPRRRERPVR